MTVSKPLLIMVGADKGGVGKTLVSRSLSDYLQSQGIKFRAFDTESPAGVLHRFNPQTTEVVDLTDTGQQVRVFDTLQDIPVTLVDVRAGLLSRILGTMGDIGLIDAVRTGSIQLMVLHVLGPTLASLQEIDATSSAIPGAIHFLVQNHVNDTKFFEWDPETYQKTFSNKRSGLLDIPRLDPLTCEHVELASTTFRQFIDNEKGGGSRADNSMVLRGYARTWLKKVFAEFDRVRINEIASVSVSS
jgi:hypothetical protein